MKKRTLYLIIIGFITIGCIIGGTIVYTNRTIYDKKYDFNNTISFSELDDFDSISIDGNIMELSFESCDNNYEGELSVHYNKEKLEPNIYVKDNTLFINQNISGNLSGNNHCIVRIVIPENLYLNSSKIKVNVGEIEINNLNSKEIDVQTNVGEIDVEDSYFNYIFCKTNVGEINIEPKKSLDEYDLTLESNVGRINVVDEHFKGSYNKKGNSSKYIKAKTNVGEINIL